MIVYLSSISFLRTPPPKLAQITKISQRCWLAGISLSLASSTAGLVKLMGEGGVRGEKEKEKAVAVQQATLSTQIVQDSLDFFLPASGLGLVNLSEGTLGGIGCVVFLSPLRFPALIGTTGS
jgi:peroxin-11B